MTNRGFTTLGIVMKRKNIGEADRLVTLLTRQEGKLVVRVSGVRKAASKRRSHLELFNTIKSQVIEAKGIPVLAQTELVHDRSHLKTRLKLLRIAYHLTEVTDHLTEERAVHPEVFDLLDRALSSINIDIWEQESRLVTAFEEKLLRLLGFGVPSIPTRQHIEEIAQKKLRSQDILKSG